jgi:hypothetical protein
VNKENDICDNCRCFDPVHDDSVEKNGYCWYHHKPVNKTDTICKKFERSYTEERIASSGEFHQGRAFAFAGIKKRKEKEFRNLILRIIEISLIALLVGVTIYFGLS